MAFSTTEEQLGAAILAGVESSRFDSLKEFIVHDFSWMLADKESYEKVMKESLPTIVDIILRCDPEYEARLIATTKYFFRHH